MDREKIKGYLGIARKAGYLIIGVDNLKKYNKKLYLLLADSDLSNTINKTIASKEDVRHEIIDNLGELMSIEKCKIVGIKNHNIAMQIIENIKGE